MVLPTVRRPLDELELGNQRGYDPVAVRHSLGRESLAPSAAGCQMAAKLLTRPWLRQRELNYWTLLKTSKLLTIGVALTSQRSCFSSIFDQF
jgi:hypothetical protein